ncbi:Hypothetical Protein FCC1311_105692 [Hondaea fermentalgiana]|uniref:Uncharacterized protein n=1 Tax=Hondaea fermentalgiana TaxID=2315210 RepID=A0A2R5GU01_9STRA|nr:Hypothetical Protein FCC1311_105692 [Hondaea fermentalgiana]|eukprot:GBG34346.1 Hypothetical Protein FCC1311_105692 [Hondaea fermentalgiana]
MQNPAVVFDAETGEALLLGAEQRRRAREEDRGEKTAQREARERVARRETLLRLQRQQHAHVQHIVDEEVEAEKQRQVQWQIEATSASAKRFLRHKFDRERAAARDRLNRIRREQEIVLVTKMAELNLIR